MPADPQARPLPNCYWVYPGELLAGEHPRRGVKTDAELRKRLRALMDAGIDSFLDLTMPEEFEAYDVELPPSVRYVRRPIRDHSLPGRREHMVEILRHLGRELRHDRRIYVHCHAGIGRTGTVVGCLLVERGVSGDVALADLNTLWQRCDRSQTWPYVPETEEQIVYVRDWKPSAASPDTATHLAALPVRTAPHLALSETEIVPHDRPPRISDTVFPAPPESPPPPVVAPRELQDRFHGAMLGLAIADALAAPAHGHKSGSFPAITGFTGSGELGLPPGAWTDDTATALCVAESLLECGASDPRDMVQRFASWQQAGHLSSTGECVGITPSTAKALAAARWRRQVYPGSHDPKQLDPEVLSRVAPAVMFGFGEVDRSAHLACEAARITCQAPGALDACRLLAASLHAALAGEPKARVLDPSDELADTTGVRARVLELRERARERPPRAFTHAADALAAAQWVLESATTFADGALLAANLGGGCDVVAAIYGQLAGAHFGAQAIPAAWRNEVAQRGLIDGFAARLLAHAQRR